MQLSFKFKIKTFLGKYKTGFGFAIDLLGKVKQPGSSLLLKIFYIFVILVSLGYIGTHIYLRLIPGKSAVAAETWTYDSVHVFQRAGYYTSVAIHPVSGIIVVGFKEEAENNAMYAYYVGDGSGNCLSTNWMCEVVDLNGNVGTWLSLSFNSSNQAVMSYYDNTSANLKYAVRDLGGTGCGTSQDDTASANWSCETVDSTGNVGTYTSIAKDGSGRPAISYYDVTNGDLKYALRVGSGGGSGCADSDWTCESVVTTNDQGQYTSLAFSAGGYAAIAFYDVTGADLEYAIRDGGNSGCADTDWTCETVASTNNQGQYNSLAFDGSGNAAIAFLDVTGGDLEYALRNGAGVGSCANNTQWNCTTIYAATNGEYNSLKFNGTQASIATWRDAGVFDQFFMTKVDTGTGTGCGTGGSTDWTCEQVETSDNVGQYSSLAINGSGQAVIAAYNATDFDLQVMVRTAGSGCTDGDWTCTNVQGTALLLVDRPSLAFTSTGTPAMAYHDASSDNVQYAVYVGGASGNCFDKDWNCETVFSTGTAGEQLDLDFNASNQAVISFSMGTDLGYAVRDGGNSGCADADWTCESVDTTNDVGDYSAISVDGNGKPGIAYMDTTNTSLRYAYRTGSGGGSGCADADWTCILVDNPTNPVGYAMDMVYDSSSKPHIVYFDNTDDRIYYTSRVGDGSGAGCTGGTENTNWRCEGINPGTTNSTETGASININGSNQAAITFYKSNSDLHYALRDGGNSGCLDAAWTCTAVATSNAVGAFTSVSFLNGQAIISYQDVTNEDVYYARNDGGSGGGGCADVNWSCELIESDGAAGAGGTSIAVYGSVVGLVYTSWQSGTNTNSDAIRYATFTDNGAPTGGYTADNVIPAAQVTQSTDGNGIMTISFRAKDPDTDTITLNTFEYSVNGGSSWSAPTNGDASNSLYKTTAGADDWDTNGATGTYSSATDFSGTVHSFYWDTKHADLSGLDGVVQTDVQIRFTLNDATVNSSSAATSASFEVDDLNPAAGTAADIVTRPNAGESNVTISGTFTETNPNTNLFYTQINDGGYGASTAGTSNTASPANQSTALGATLDGDDCVTDVKIVHTDDFGNQGTNENNSPSLKCAVPYTPSGPTVAVISATSQRVTINQHASETGAVQYAIQEQGSTNYVQDDGTLGASAIWQTYAAWGGGSGIAVTGLTESTSYTFRVKARNPNDTSNTETSFSAGVAATTEGNPVIGYTIANTIPAAQISQSTDGNGIMTIQFRLKDADADADITLNTFQYSVNGGAAWNAPTNGDASNSLYKTTAGADDWDTNGATGTYASATDFSGTTYSFYWNTKHADLSGLDLTDQSDVMIRFSANDGTNASVNPGTSEQFSVDDQNPTVNTAANITSRGSAGATTMSVSVVFSENNPNTNAFYVQVNDGGYGAATNGDTNTATPSTQAVTLAAALDGDDCVTDVKVTHTDDFGNLASSENNAPSLSCAVPYTPAAVTAESTGPTQMNVKVNANGSETGSVQYAMRALYGSSTYYVQSNGALGLSADWTLTQGTLISVDGLLADGEYTFQAMARNPNDTANTESAYSTAVIRRTATNRRRDPVPVRPTEPDLIKPLEKDREQQEKENQDLLQNTTLDQLMIVFEDPEPTARRDRYMNLTVSLNDKKQVVLTWDDPEVEDPNVVYIFRNYSPSRTAFSLIDGVKFGKQQYIDTNVFPGKTYYYRVRTFDVRQDSVISDPVGIKIPKDNSPQKRFIAPTEFIDYLLEYLMGIKKL